MSVYDVLQRHSAVRSSVQLQQWPVFVVPDVLFAAITLRGALDADEQVVAFCGEHLKRFAMADTTWAYVSASPCCIENAMGLL